MNDIRRTLLWVAFTMSLLLLWDRWHVFNGEQSIFSPRPAKTAVADKPVPSVTTVNEIPTAVASAASGAASAAELPAQLVTIQTDVVKATLNTRGGDILDLDLLKYQQTDNHSELLRQAKKLI